jgi:hypothetical protein
MNQFFAWFAPPIVQRNELCVSAALCLSFFDPARRRRSTDAAQNGAQHFQPTRRCPENLLSATLTSEDAAVADLAWQDGHPGLPPNTQHSMQANPPVDNR